MSCFCSPLGSRSLGTRQHLSAPSSLFHARDVGKDSDGSPQWRAGHNCSWRDGAVPQPGGRSSRFSGTGSRSSRSRLGPLRNEPVSRWPHQDIPSTRMFPGEAEKILKLVCTLNISVTESTVFFFRVTAIFLIHENGPCALLPEHRSPHPVHLRQPARTSLCHGTQTAR